MANPVGTVTRAWDAFMAAISEARELHASGGNAAAIQDLLQHARELLDIIDDEVKTAGVVLPAPAQSSMELLRAQLATLETTLGTEH
jgi:hypothetical protein